MMFRSNKGFSASSLNCWHKAGCTYAFMVVTLNSDPTKIQIIRPGNIFQSSIVHFCWDTGGSNQAQVKTMRAGQTMTKMGKDQTNKKPTRKRTLNLKQISKTKTQIINSETWRITINDVRETQKEKETQQNQQIKRGPQNTTKTLQKTGIMTCAAESEQVSFKVFLWMQGWRICAQTDEKPYMAL